MGSHPCGTGSADRGGPGSSRSGGHGMVERVAGGPQPPRAGVGEEGRRVPAEDGEENGPPAYLGGSVAGSQSPAAGALMVGGQPLASVGDEDP